MRRIGICLLVFLLICAGTASSAETLMLPASVIRIEDESFSGDCSISRVILPETLTEIGRSAFQGCSSLKHVSLPASLQSIGDACFDGCAEAVYFACIPGTPGAAWVRSSGFDYTAGTVCRALIIAQLYPGDPDLELVGPANDADAVSHCLSRFQQTPFLVHQKQNLSGSGILNAVSSVFADAGEDDISLIYYSGHGDEGGLLCGCDGIDVSPSQLCAALDQIPGRKIIIVDACCSGGLLEEDAANPVQAVGSVQANTASNAASGFVSAFTSAFSTKTRSVIGSNGKYFVLTAARADELSQEGPLTYGDGAQKTMGYFTFSLTLGLGWNGITDSTCAAYADTNSDNAVTIQEAYLHASRYAKKLNSAQTAMVWPASCTWFSPFRNE